MKIICKLRWVILTSTIKMLLITKKQHYAGVISAQCCYDVYWLQPEA